MRHQIQKNNLLSKARVHLKSILSPTDSPILFLSSGGSALSLLTTEILSSDCSNLTITVADERFGVKEKQSNFVQLFKTDFAQKLISNGGKILQPFSCNSSNINDADKEFEGKLRKWKNQNPEGNIVATLGIGTDGHTLGVMPNQNEKKFDELFVKTDKWVVGYDAGEQNQIPLRVTTTLSFAQNQINQALVFAWGKDKQQALKKVFSSTGKLYLTPGRVVHMMKKVDIFVDTSF